MEYTPGMVIKGKVTGLQPYGAFVSFDDQTTGLIHISEMSNGFVKDVFKVVQVNEEVTVKVIDVEQHENSNYLRLSLKAVEKNPVRKHRRMSQIKQLKKLKIGFKTLEENLPIWIQQAMGEINHD